MSEGLLSDSECLVLGALLAANANRSETFFPQFEAITRILGLSNPPSIKEVCQEVPNVPADTIWGTSDGSTLLTASEMQDLQDDHRNEMRLAEEFIAEAELSEGFHPAFAEFLRQYAATGYSPSTPTKVYGLAITGELHLCQEVAPLHQGLIRSLLAMLSSSTLMPLQWRMAVPPTVADIPAEFWDTSFVPGVALPDVECGSDDPVRREATLRNLKAEETNSDAFVIGDAIWTTIALVREFILRNGSPDSAETDKALQVELSPPPEFSDDVPELVAVFFKMGWVAQNNAGGQLSGDSGHVSSDALEQAVARVTEARGAAERLGMTNVTSVLDELSGLFGIWKHNASLISTFGGDMAWVAQRQEEAVRMAHGALCVAYGDLLLRERFTPAPIPQGAARGRLLRLPANVRSLVTTALGRLRRDGRVNDNYAVELALLCNVLELLVRDAAAIYIPDTRAHTVADLLYVLLKKSDEAQGQDRNDIETIARVGTALHHAFRNPVTHNIQLVNVGVEQAMFVAYGVLVLLDTIERATVKSRR